MNVRRIQIELAVLFICIAHCDAQVSDITPPRLVAFEISPTTVDVSTNAQTITLTARITDDLSGFGWPDSYPSSAIAYVSFRPSGLDGFFQSAVTAMFSIDSRTSGADLDGVYTADLNIPAHSHTGTWILSGFTLRDAVGNSANLLAGDVHSLGFPVSFTVTGVDDRNPPQVVSLSIEPTTVDTSATNQTITITTRITEDVSLTILDEYGRPIPPSSIISFASPSKKQATAAGVLTEQISGDEHDGVFRTTVNLRQFSEPGVWQLSNLRVSDGAGNMQFIDFGTALAKGLAAEFTVTGAGDTNPPVLRAFNISPRRIGLPTTNQTVMATAHYSDDLVGFYSAFDVRGPIPTIEFVEFQSPSKRQSARATFFLDSTQFGPLDVVSSNTINFPRYCETGVWTLSALSLRDGLNNATNLDATAIRALGFPTEIAVGISPSIAIVRQGDSLLLSWPSWGSDFHLQSRGFGATSIWKPVTIQPAAIGEQMVVAVLLSTDSLLFRLIE